MLHRAAAWVLLVAIVAVFLPARGLAEPPACGGENLLARLAKEAPQDLAAIEAEAADIANGEGILWKLERPGQAPSWLFGTIHVTDPRLIRLPAGLDAALGNARTVAVESLDALDPESFARNIDDFRGLILYQDGRTLAAHLSDDERALLNEALKPLGIDITAAGRMKPWMFAVALSVPACETARRKEIPVVDAVVAKTAKERGIEVVGLETTKEQLSAFDAIAPALQVDYLASTARLLPQMNDLFATIADLYRERRTGLVQALSHFLGNKTGLSEKAYIAFNDNFIDRRNAIMAERAMPLVARGGAVIAVGALHLPGDKGLVEIFRAAGYAVTRID